MKRLAAAIISIVLIFTACSRHAAENLVFNTAETENETLETEETENETSETKENEQPENEKQEESRQSFIKQYLGPIIFIIVGTGIKH